MKRLLYILIFTAISSSLLAQTTKIKGRVTDSETGEGLPFASVYFPGTSIGVSTDLDGYYTLETRDLTVELLRVEMMGYDFSEKKIKPGVFNQTDFVLKAQTNLLDKIVVKPDYRYIRWILSNIEKGKKMNNPEERDRYQCRLYTKMELDLVNADKQIRNKLLRKNFGFVFDYMDTSVISGQPYLPIMISENNSMFYKQKDPSSTKEVIEATRISGVKDEATIAQFTGNMHIRTNFYDDFINLFNVQIPSPVKGPNVYYDYFLIDSLMIDGRKTYHIRFHPAKMVSSPTFDGEMRIDAQDWAVREIHVKLKKGSNVNWIRDLVLDSEYQLVGGRGSYKGKDSLWFFKQDKMYADFSVTMRDSSKLMSFLGRRQCDYLDPYFNKPMPENVAHLMTSVTTARSNPLVDDENYWQNNRPFPLSQKERNIYKMVDSIKSVPLYRNIYTIVNTFVNGYYNFKYFGVGPYYKLFSFNNLEGARFQFGGRTTEDFSKKLRLSGHIAYGTKDHDFKGKIMAEYMFNNTPTRKLIASASRDVLQMGRGAGALTEANIMSSLLNKGNSERISPVNEYTLGYIHEWNQGFNNSISIEGRRVYSNRYVPMFTPDSVHVTSVASNQLHYTARFSWDETVTRGTFDKLYVLTHYPVITLDLIYGVKGMADNDFGYFRVESTLDYKLQLPPVGTSKFQLTAGKIIGKVPYPLLKLHEGNGTYFLDKTSFACMDFYEFASDTWTTLFYEHNFKGFFLGKIPLMKRLQWREVFTLKAGYGTLSRRNNGITDGKIGNPGSTIPGTGPGALYEGMNAVMLFPEGMSSLRKPYIEMGVGVTNILRVFRVDCFWRMTHRTKVVNGKTVKAKHRAAINFGFEWSF
ncbi:MAG: carboxypeptidase-like regulatory domain-containing protein [Bacteroidales bacterium]|nr:carboxypeptidase-like regulatory domain-containing protein [Bacteroidales bacterium]